MKVRICREDMTQIQLGREMVCDRLPDDVRKQVVWRDKYWLTDEALSTYVKSAGLFGNETHSPIQSVANGIQALVCRFKEQTSKGIMWQDIGSADGFSTLVTPGIASAAPQRFPPLPRTLPPRISQPRHRTKNPLEAVRQSAHAD